MSDFAGIWRLDEQVVSDADLSRLSQGLEGRGIGPARLWRNGSLAIVHRQHYFTPEDYCERMPLAGETGSVLVGDFRLDNRDGLAPLLGLAGPAADIPDSVFVLRALERWGADAMARLYGDLSLACWQPRTQTLMLARTHLRLRSVFLHRGINMIAFASRMRPLLALPEIPLDVDEAAMAASLIGDRGVPQRTHYKAIDRIPLAHVAVVSRETTATRKFWSVPEPGTLRFKRSGEVVDAAQAVLDDAVRACLRSKGPVGIGLTSGIDSTALVLSARRQVVPERFFALTLVPNGDTAPADPRFCRDESSDAEALAARYPDIDWQRVSQDGDDWGEWDQQRWFLEAGIPSANPINAAWFFPAYRLISRRGGNVFMGGGFGNFFFSSDGGAVGAALLRQGRFIALWRLLRECSRAERTGLLRAFSSQVLLPYRPLSTLYRHNGRPPAPWYQIAAVNPGFAAEIDLGRRVDRSRYRTRFGGKHRNIRISREYLLFCDANSDWCGPHRAISGTEIRNPLADRRLIDFFASLPQEEFIRGGVRRSLARALIRGHAPQSTVDNTRLGDQVSDWFAIMTSRRAQMLETLPRLKQSPAACRMIDLDRLESVLKDWPADAAAAERRRMEAYFVLSRGFEYAAFLAWREQHNG